MNSLQINFWAMILTLCAGLLAISNQSLWIDEANTAMAVIQPDWEAFTDKLVQEKHSDLQMPFYMTYLWGWEKVFGHGERALRLANLPFWLIAHAVVLWGLARRTKWAISYVVLASVSPFLWQYLDEARPYIMQYMGAVLLLVAQLRWMLVDGPNECASVARCSPEPRQRANTVEWVLACSGTLILCGSSLVGVILSGALWLGFLTAIWKGNRWKYIMPSGKTVYAMLMVTLLSLAALAVFYLWTLWQGAGAARMGSAGWRSLVFALYEFAGFAGWGPGRDAIRMDPVGAVTPYAGALLIVALAYLLLAAGWLVRITQCQKQWEWERIGTPLVTLLVSVAVGLGTMLVLSGLFEFRLLGRHLMPLFPIWLGLVSWMLMEVFRMGRAGKAAAILLVGVMLLSCFQYRWSERHAKDDYRGAAEIARRALAEGKRISWAADTAGGIYYGVVGEGVAYCIEPGKNLEALLHKGRTEMVFLSKPDMFDPTGQVRLLAEERVTKTTALKAFIVYVVHSF